jgi:tetratricopeptide (TPR) repeat protein
MHQTIGHYEQVEAMYQRALTIYKKSYGPHHSDVAKSLLFLGKFYRIQKKYEASKTCYLQALQRLVKILSHFMINIEAKEERGFPFPKPSRNLGLLSQLFRREGPVLRRCF